MKKLLLCLLLIFTSYFSFSQYIINDSFEGETVGEYPSNWTLKYNGTATANQQVVSSPVKNGSNAFQLEGAPSWAATALQTVSNLPNNVTLESWVYIEKITSGLVGRFGFYNSTVGSWGTSVIGINFYNGNFTTSYSGGNVYTLQSYSTNTWYHLKIELNTITKKYKVYINGILVSGTNGSTTVYEFDAHPTVAIKEIELTAGNSTTVKVTYDDVKLYNTGEKLIAHYPFNGNANDISGFARHGTVNGATLTTDRDGNENAAYLFDGIDDYIDLGDWENGGEMSISFWARWDAFNNYSRIVDLGNGASSNNIIVSNRQTNNALFFQVYNAGSDAVYQSTITQGTWEFFTATVASDGTMKIYKNGNFLTQNTNGQVPNLLTRTSQFVGRSNFSQDGYFKGAVDDLRIYNYPLTETEINTLYNTSTLGIETHIATVTKIFYISNNILFFKNSETINNVKKFSVYNYLGQDIYKTSQVNHQMRLPINNSGPYIAKLQLTNGQNYSLKFIIK